MKKAKTSNTVKGVLGVIDQFLNNVSVKTFKREGSLYTGKVRISGRLLAPPDKDFPDAPRETGSDTFAFELSLRVAAQTDGTLFPMAQLSALDL